MKKLLVLALLMGSVQSFAQDETPVVGEHVNGGVVTDVHTNKKKTKTKDMTVQYDNGATMKYQKGGLLKRSKVTITTPDGQKTVVKARGGKRLLNKMEKLKNKLESEAK